MKFGHFAAKKLPVIAAAFLVCVSWFSCEVPSSAKSPGGGGGKPAWGGG